MKRTLSAAIAACLALGIPALANATDPPAPATEAPKKEAAPKKGKKGTAKDATDKDGVKKEGDKEAAKPAPAGW